MTGRSITNLFTDVEMFMLDELQTVENAMNKAETLALQKWAGLEW